MNRLDEMHDTHERMAAGALRLMEVLTSNETDQVFLGFEAIARPPSYRPHARAGLPLGALNNAARKASYQLLSEAVSPHTFAQITTIMGFEEVLDRNANWSKHQHSSDYYVAIYGDPTTSNTWAWKMEGHHVSITVFINGQRVHASPLFLGANPDHVVESSRSILRPLAAEDEIALCCVQAMTPHERSAAIVSPDAPNDVRFFLSAPRPLQAGIKCHDMNTQSRTLLNLLMAVYVGRLSEGLRSHFSEITEHPSLTFSWAGSLIVGEAHNYCIQADEDLLIEYGNNYHGQAKANHSHTFIRIPKLDSLVFDRLSK